MPRLTMLKIRNFKGFEALDVEFADDGVVRIQGPNESGKTSIIEALRVAFEGATSEVIRDEKKGPAMITVATDALEIRRRVTTKKTDVAVSDRDTGAKMHKPGTLLRQLADVLAFRPLDLLGASDQVAKVAETLGLKLKPEDLDRALDALGWEGEEAAKENQRLLGLNAIDALRYVQTQLEHKRREHNRAASALQSQVEDLRGKVGPRPPSVSEVEAEIQTEQAAAALAREEHALSMTADNDRAEIVRLTGLVDEKQTKLDDMPTDEQHEKNAEAWFDVELENVKAVFSAEREALKRKMEELDAREADREVALREEMARRHESFRDTARKTAEATRAEIEEITRTLSTLQERTKGIRDPEDLEAEVRRHVAQVNALGDVLMRARLYVEFDGKVETLKYHQDASSELTEVLDHYRGEPGRLLRETGIPIDKLDVSDDGRSLLFANEDGKLLPWAQHATSRRLRAAVEVLCHRIRDRELKLLCVDGVEVVDEAQREAFFSWLDTKREDGYHVFVTEATVNPEGATIALS